MEGTEDGVDGYERANGDTGGGKSDGCLTSCCSSPISCHYDLSQETLYCYKIHN